ncbi:MAG: hypothetical protein A2096_15990 [Spirochaetes bacterium GWF1_41_5]|nr:MAG: hypothetical protein A2096_15990 [Spirochaetes bacterium GWF1_41_5]
MIVKGAIFLGYASIFSLQKILDIMAHTFFLLSVKIYFLYFVKNIHCFAYPRNKFVPTLNLTIDNIYYIFCTIL